MNLIYILSALKGNPHNDIMVLLAINSMESLGIFAHKTDEQKVQIVWQVCRECGCGPGTIGKGWIHFNNQDRRILPSRERSVAG